MFSDITQRKAEGKFPKQNHWFLLPNEEIRKTIKMA